MKKLNLEPEAAATPVEDGYEEVEGLDPASQQCIRAHEVKAAEKTASDYAHIVWAYGIIWVVFAIYGALLWRRAVQQRTAIDDLKRRIAKS